MAQRTDSIAVMTCGLLELRSEHGMVVMNLEAVQNPGSVLGS
jgi:hypothetical protein